jgi:hypothetical protein
MVGLGKGVAEFDHLDLGEDSHGTSGLSRLASFLTCAFGARAVFNGLGIGVGLVLHVF